jgi:hypothetical protein
LHGAARFARVAASAPWAHCVSVPGRRRGRVPLLYYSPVSPPGALPGLCPRRLSLSFFSVEGGPDRIL